MSAREESPVKRGLQFVAEARNELSKVSFPSRKETTAVTMVVIVVVFIIGFYLAVIDWGLSQIIKTLVR